MKNLILSISIALLSINAYSQNAFCDQIVVEGKSSVKLAPEQLIFNINISVTDTNYARCSNLALNKIEEFKKQFSENGIGEESIKTRSYSIREIRERDYQTNKQVFKGYRADIPLIIKTKTDNPKNDLIFEIIKNNFSADFTLIFALTPEQLEAVKENLITLAVEDAKQKAMIIAKSAGVKLGNISKVQYGEPQKIRNFTGSNPELLRAENLSIRGMSSVGPSSFQPNDIEMRTEIIIAWRIGE